MDTTQLAVLLFLVVAILVILVILFFGWAVKTGQFKDIEGVKYRMLEEDGEERGAAPGAADEDPESGPVGPRTD